MRWIGKTAFPAMVAAPSAKPAKKSGWTSFSSAADEECDPSTSLLQAPAAHPVAVSWLSGGAKLPEIMVAIPAVAKAAADGADSPCLPRSGEGLSEVALYEALLPYDPPTHDVGWLRMPMMIGGLVIVFGYQFIKGRGKGGGGGILGGRRGRRGGGRAGLSDDYDFDEAAMARSFDMDSLSAGRGPSRGGSRSYQGTRY